jgi:hypothetical protein
MERIGEVLQSSVLPTTSSPLQRRLSSKDRKELGLLLGQMAQRYPGQDLSDAMAGFLLDCETLALKYSLPKVRAALAELRIRPDQDYFPKPNEVAREIERQQEISKAAAAERAGKKQREEWEVGFWLFVDEQLAENPEMSEQEFLDSIKMPGYTGRKARSVPR